MAVVFTYSNTSRAANDYAGRQLFRLKEAMVLAGWTVRGSGDGGTGATRFAFNTTESSTATAGAATTLTDGAQAWTTNQWATGTVTILSGTGAGQTRTISSNTGTVLTVSSAWATNPDATSVYSLSITAATPGSGGSYDVWVTGNARTNSTPVTAGDAGNAGAWCLLECGVNGRQILLQTTTGTGTGASGYSGYANIVYAPMISGTGMTGLTADANVAPGAASAYEYNIIGSRNTAGSDAFGWTVAGYYHIWYDDEAAADSPAAVGMVSVDTSTETAKILAFGGVEPNTSTDDDKFVWMFSSSGISSFTGYGFDDNGGTVSGLNGGLDTSYWVGGGAALGTDRGIAQYPMIFPGSYSKGLLHRSMGMQCCVAGAWGDRGTDQNGLVYAYLATYGFLMPWVAEATAPLPGANSIVDFFEVTIDPALPSTYYTQKVWDAGTGGWCYYSLTTITASPLAAQTVPNYTGAISNHVVLGETPP